MKTLMKLRRRLGHLAIGPLVGAILAGILLMVLMLNINNDQNSIRETNGDKHAYISVPVRLVPVS